MLLILVEDTLDINIDVKRNQMTIDQETRERALRSVAASEKKAVEQMEDNASLNTQSGRDYTAAIKIAAKLIKQPGIEGCELRAYPDAASELYKTLAEHGILRRYMDGKLELPPYLAELDGSPVTIGWGHTEGVKLGDVITQEQADKWLEDQLAVRVAQVVKAAPKLAQASNEAIAACVSLQYNVGQKAFADSTVVKKIALGDMLGAAEAFGMWVKAKGQVMQGLVNRRKIEANLFRSVKA
jgi:lysozyme